MNSKQKIKLGGGVPKLKDRREEGRGGKVGEGRGGKGKGGRGGEGRKEREQEERKGKKRKELWFSMV